MRKEVIDMARHLLGRSKIVYDHPSPKTTNTEIRIPIDWDDQLEVWLQFSQAIADHVLEDEHAAVKKAIDAWHKYVKANKAWSSRPGWRELFEAMRELEDWLR